MTLKGGRVEPDETAIDKERSVNMSRKYIDVGNGVLYAVRTEVI
jgi:hypothetical protein